MRRYKIFIGILVLGLMFGCKENRSRGVVDPRPPLMDTSAFTNFIPVTPRPRLENLDVVVERTIKEATNAVNEEIENVVQ